MGLIRTIAAIRNPAEPDQVWEGTFLVDTGAIDCLVPRPHLEAIGLKPEGQRVYSLADGTSITMDVTVGRVELMDIFVGATIIFGDADAEPLLGVTALESMGIEVDPLKQTLMRQPTVSLRGGLRPVRPDSDLLAAAFPVSLSDRPDH